MAKKPTKDQLLWLQEHASDELRALPIGPARTSEHARWLNAAWQCAKVALGERRAQPGSSRADALALCARIIAGETVPIDELRRVTTPKGERDFLREHHAAKKPAAQLDAEIAEALARTPGASDLRVGQLFDRLGHIYEVAKIGRDKNRTVQIARRVRDPFNKEVLIDHRSFPARDLDREYLRPIDAQTAARRGYPGRA
jgi:hypothetical protein